VLPAMQVITLLLLALAMVPAVAHALELPGKKRLTKETYLAVQPIYYPGFTIIGGFGEFAGMSGCGIRICEAQPPHSFARGHSREISQTPTGERCAIDGSTPMWHEPSPRCRADPARVGPRREEPHKVPAD